VADLQPAQPPGRLEETRVGDAEGLAGDPGGLRGLPFGRGVPAAPSGQGEVQVGQKNAQCGASAFTGPGRGLDPGAERGEPFVDMVARLHRRGAAHERARGLPDALDVVTSTGMAGACRDRLDVPPTLVVGLHQQTQKLIHGAVGAGDVAGDGRGDAVTVVGGTLPVQA
jgi:hypothetical protein